MLPVLCALKLLLLLLPLLLSWLFWFATLAFDVDVRKRSFRIVRYFHVAPSVAVRYGEYRRNSWNFFLGPYKKVVLVACGPNGSRDQKFAVPHFGLIPLKKRSPLTLMNPCWSFFAGMVYDRKQSTPLGTADVQLDTRTVALSNLCNVVLSLFSPIASLDSKRNSKVRCLVWKYNRAKWAPCSEKLHAEMSAEGKTERSKTQHKAADKSAARYVGETSGTLHNSTNRRK